MKLWTNHSKNHIFRLNLSWKFVTLGVDNSKLLTCCCPWTQLTIGNKRNTELQGPSGKTKRDFNRFADVWKWNTKTFLAEKRKLHSKCQKWEDSDNIKQSTDSAETQSVEAPWEAVQGSGISQGTLNKGVKLPGSLPSCWAIFP